MKTCRKCKTVNGSTTSFCSRCGSRLPTGFPSFEMSFPDTAPATPLKAKEYIVHPLQKETDLILPENIGRKISPAVNRQKTNPEKIITAPEKKLTPEKHSTEHKAEKNTHPVNTTKTPVSLSKPDSTISNKDSVARKSAPMERKLLLTPADRLLLKKQLNPSGFRGLKPEDNPFAMLKAEEIAAKKQQNIAEEERKKRITEDMAYLEQLFSRKSGSSIAAKRDESIRFEKTVTSNPVRESSAPESVINEKSPAAKPEKTPPLKPQRIAINKNIRPEDNHSHGLRHLKENHGSEKVELLSPFLTLAAFLYFCYVLYI